MELTQNFEARYAGWLARLNIRVLGWERVPRESLMDLAVPPRVRTLQEAVASAGWIVVAAAVAIDPTLFSGTKVTLQVTQTLKGAPLAQVTLVQPGGLDPTSDWKGVIVGTSVTNPLLLPGQRAMLFLSRAPASGEFTVQPVTGLCMVVDGQLQPVVGNPFGAEVAGKTLSEVSDRVWTMVLS